MLVAWGLYRERGSRTLIEWNRDGGHGKASAGGGEAEGDKTKDSRSPKPGGWVSPLCHSGSFPPADPRHAALWSSFRAHCLPEPGSSPRPARPQTGPGRGHSLEEGARSLQPQSLPCVLCHELDGVVPILQARESDAKRR